MGIGWPYSVLGVLLAINASLLRCYPKFYMPLLVSLSLLAAIFCGCMTYEVWYIMNSTAVHAVKVSVSITVGVFFAVVATIIVCLWVKWFRKGRDGK